MVTLEQNMSVTKKGDEVQQTCLSAGPAEHSAPVAGNKVTQNKADVG